MSLPSINFLHFIIKIAPIIESRTKRTGSNSCRRCLRHPSLIKGEGYICCSGTSYCSYFLFATLAMSPHANLDTLRFVDVVVPFVSVVSPAAATSTSPCTINKFPPFPCSYCTLCPKY